MWVAWRANRACPARTGAGRGCGNSLCGGLNKREHACLWVHGWRDGTPRRRAFLRPYAGACIVLVPRFHVRRESGEETRSKESATGVEHTRTTCRPHVHNMPNSRAQALCD
eukprot:358921-Chlamydomonas_euryale.AAC.5